jgi:hypothetical protein
LSKPKLIKSCRAEEEEEEEEEEVCTYYRKLLCAFVFPNPSVMQVDRERYNST